MPDGILSKDTMETDKKYPKVTARLGESIVTISVLDGLSRSRKSLLSKAETRGKKVFGMGKEMAWKQVSNGHVTSLQSRKKH